MCKPLAYKRPLYLYESAALLHNICCMLHIIYTQSTHILYYLCENIHPNKIIVIDVLNIQRLGYNLTPKIPQNMNKNKHRKT